MLRDYPESAYVFISERLAPMTAATFRKLLARAGDAANLGMPIHPHMLRHSTGFKLANDGQDTRAIQHYLGHRIIQHTVLYTQLASDRFNEAGTTVDFLLTAKRDRKAALRFLRKAIKWNGTPKKITIDKSGANTAAIESHNAETEAGIKIRQIKYLNNIVEQDHRAIKRVVQPMLGFKSFRSAAVTLAGIELMHMIRKGQLRTTGEVCPARQFYSLAG